MSYNLMSRPNRTAQWGWPRARVPGVIVVHTTENSPFNSTVWSLADFMANRADYGSYHILADQTTVLPLVSPDYAAWGAVNQNDWTLHVSGVAQASQWGAYPQNVRDSITRNMGKAAAQLVKDALNRGVLTAAPPARRISRDQALAKNTPGFLGHGDLQPIDRTDPGGSFNWGLFFDAYQAALGGTNIQGTTKEWWEMPIPDSELKKIEDRAYLGALNALKNFMWGKNAKSMVTGKPIAVTELLEWIDKNVVDQGKPDLTVDYQAPDAKGKRAGFTPRFLIKRNNERLDALEKSIAEMKKQQEEILKAVTK